MLIRDVQISDLVAIDALEGEAFGSDRWSLYDYAWYAQQGYRGLVLVSPDTLVGPRYDVVLGTVWFGEDDAGDIEIATLAVFKEHRGKGYGRQLLTRAIADWSWAPDTKLYLNVRLDNTAAIELYRSEGFEIVKTQPSYYRDGAPAYRMELPAAILPG